MIQSTNRDWSRSVGRGIRHAVNEWVRHADAQQEALGVPVTIAASWTKDGCLVVIARGDKANQLDALLIDESLAEPQNRHDDLLEQPT